MALIILCLLVIGSIKATVAAVDEQKQAVLTANSYLQRDAFFQASDYVFDYSGATGGNSLPITQAYGSATFIQIPQTPSLIGTSLGSTRFDLKSCAVLSPHTHRADVQIYVLEGQIRAGFVIQSFGKLIENTLDVGKGMILPRGSLMYFANPSAQNSASFIASYSSNDFGVDLVIPLLFHSLPSDIVQAAMGGLSAADYQNIKNNVPDNQIYALNKNCA